MFAIPFLVLIVGISSFSMFQFGEKFAKAVFILVIFGYLTSVIIIRNLLVVSMALYKHLRAKQKKYLISKRLYSENQKELVKLAKLELFSKKYGGAETEMHTTHMGTEQNFLSRQS